MQRQPLQCFSLHMAQSLFEILRDWSEIGGLGNSLILTYEQNSSE